MSRIAEKFEALGRTGSGAYIPYICAGDPDFDFSLSLIKSLCKGGADIIELGIPFSDPIADGPVIQQAMQRSLSSGFKMGKFFDLVGSVRSGGMTQPMVAMSYLNPIMQYGPERFCSDFSEAGGDGILVVDLPLEESSMLEPHAEANGIDIIRLVTPTTDDERLKSIIAASSGFIYSVSVAGTTGVRSLIPSATLSMLQKVAGLSPRPVVVGFGISRPEQVLSAMSAGASGIVEGSKLVSIYTAFMNDQHRADEEIETHAREMKAATNLRNR